MRIARVVTTTNEICWGRMIDERTLNPLRGDLFSAHEFRNEVVEAREFLAPVDPPNIFAIGLNYRRHAEEQNAPLPERPLIFIKATTARQHPGRPIVLPRSAPNEVDFEAELAIVIGRSVKNVSEADAFSAVLGYTCANDVSARDCQKKLDKQWARGKSFDTFCPLGPWIVTRDSLDPDACPISTRVNGETLQQSNTNDLIFSCRMLISYLSHQFTLLPGTVILTGTPEGVGMFRNPPRYLRPGDRVEVEVGGIGVLANTVASED
ncbi:MAG: fumarylacetoacetate hydrolase family protein [Phycisphaerales bacterium]|nr:fumarylacetoacetate hydrolase family protein [Phycisphaerales bacterium]